MQIFTCFNDLLPMNYVWFMFELWRFMFIIILCVLSVIQYNNIQVCFLFLIIFCFLQIFLTSTNWYHTSYWKLKVVITSSLEIASKRGFEEVICWATISDQYFHSISMFDRIVEHSDVVWKSCFFDIMYVLQHFHNNAKVITSYISYNTRSCLGRKE